MSQSNVSKILSQRSQTTEVQPPVISQKKRRVWTSAAKLKVLSDLDLLKGQHVETGIYLRRNGLYISSASKWRKLRREGLLGVQGKKRGPEPLRTAQQVENERLMRENTKLQRELEKAKRLIEIQKKITALMEDTD